MKLPAHVLTKLSLAGAVGAVAVIATLHARQAKPQPILDVIEEEAAPLSEVVRETPEPMPLRHFAEPPPPAPQPRPIVKKAKPKPQPVTAAHVCGPCGMG